MAQTRDWLSRLRAAPATAAGLRAERKRISQEVAGWDRAAVLRLAHDLIAAGVARFLPYELVLHHEAARVAITRPEVEALGAGMAHWGDVDCFACFIGGRAWRCGRISDAAVRAWTRSEDWCWRRAALVSTVPLNSRAQGGAGDASRTLDICARLVSDRHDLVVKALSWALRELGKRQPGAVRRFLAKHREELAPRVIREVRNKLETGRKNPRR